ncbi:MAG: sialidase family protein [Planctomycetota bacterium]
MRRLPRPAVAFLLALAACGGSSKKGSSDPPLLPNEPPVLQVPAGLAGTSPRYSLTLPIAESRTLVFAATDAEEALLLWQLAVNGAGAAAAGLTFTSPVRGTAFTLQIGPVAAPVAVGTQLLVEDPRGAAAAIDLLIVRSGPPTVTGITPGSAFATRAQKVEVTGSALQLGGTASTTLAFGGLAAADLVVVDDTKLTASTPISAAPGPTIVGVSTLFGTASLPATAFTMHAFPPVLLAADARIDAGGASSFEVARSVNTAHGVWLEGSNVIHRVSTDRGATWSAPQTLSGPEAASEPQLLVAGSEVSVAWIGDLTSVLLRRSTDGGVTFLPVQRLDPAGTITPARRPRLAQSGLRRYAAWTSGSEGAGNARIFAAVSANGGIGWNTAVAVADGGANQRNHELACDGQFAWVLCEDDRLPGPRGAFVARTTDGGATWLAAQRLDAPGTAVSNVRLDASFGRVFAAWVQTGALVLRISTDRGATWNSTITEIQGAQSGAVSEPRMAGSDTQVAFAYLVGGTAVKAARLLLISSTVSTVNLDTTAAVSAAPELRVAGNYQFVAWRDGEVGTGAARIQYAVSTDNGTTFPAATGFGNGAAAQDLPRLAVDGAHLFVGWIDLRGATAGVFTNRTSN